MINVLFVVRVDESVTDHSCDTFSLQMRGGVLEHFPTKSSLRYSVDAGASGWGI